MTKSRPPQRAFSSGEISPLLFARTDYQRFQTGAALMNGFVPIRQGGFTRAPGTIYRGQTRGNQPAQLMKFEFAVNDTLTLEFTDGFMRVWRYGVLIEQGGAPYELATPYAAASIGKLQGVQAADVIYLVDGFSPVQKLSRYALDNWTIEPVDFKAGPFRVQNLDEAVTIQCSADSGTITLTGAGDPFSAAWIGALVRLTPKDYSEIALWSGNTAIAIGDMMRYGENIYELVEGTNTGVNPPIHTEGTRLVDSAKNTKWIFKSDSSGIVRITDVADANTATAEVLKTIPQPCVTAATYRWSEGAWSDTYGYPRALEIYDQSLFAAFTSQEPRTVWASTLGDLENFEPSGEADGSFAYTIAGSSSLNSGNWLRRARRGLYIGALGEVYRAYSNAPGQRIGPTTFDTSLEATDGCSDTPAIVPYGFPVFVTKDGKRMQEIRYSFEEDGGKPVELSLPSSHLGEAGFLEAVWQSAPQKLAWVRRATGDLVAMLYDPSEDVLGWARCSLAGGFVESMSVTADGAGNDILTMVVRRNIEGADSYMIEEQAVTYGIIAADQAIDQAVHFFAASIFDLEVATDTFSVPHLAGQSVYVWSNVGNHGPFDVSGTGELTIDQPVTRATIGLFDATHLAETLAITAQAKDGATEGRARRLHAKSGLHLHRTAAGRVRTVERNFGQATVYGRPKDMIPQKIAADLVEASSGVVQLEITSGFAAEVACQFIPEGGAPMTVLAFIPSIEEAGA